MTPACARRCGLPASSRQQAPARSGEGNAPVRGLLRVEPRSGYGWDTSGRNLCAHLTVQHEAVAALPMLDHCRVTKITDRGILILGMEEVDLTGREWKNFRQAWWVRPVQE